MILIQVDIIRKKGQVLSPNSPPQPTGPTQEFYVVPDFPSVIKKLKPELEDKDVTILGIATRCNITKIIQ